MTEQVKKKANRVKSTEAISGIMTAFYDRMFDEGSKVCWCVGACPYEMFSAAKIRRFQTENASARISASGIQDMFIEAAEAEGMSTDCCSYAKINVGHAIMMVRGEESRIPEKFRLPKPHMIFALNTCPSMIQWCDSLAEVFKVPSFVVDAPFIYDEKNWDKDINYVKSQLEDLIVFIEKFTGQPYDWQSLTDTMYKIREMTRYRRKVKELIKLKPAPCSFFDGAIAMGPGNTCRDDATLEFYKAFCEEIEQRAQQGIGVIQDEKYRIMWRGNFPWHKVGMLSRLMTKYDAMIVTGPYANRCYGNMAMSQLQPEGFDMSDPLRTIAADHCARSYTRRLDWKFGNEFREFIDGLSIDGVIIHSPRTCRPWALGAFEMAKMVDAEYGIPVLVLEADHTDPNFFNDAQVETKIQALLETIDANREKKQVT